jgi:putative phosphoribosyl transferase
MDRFTNRREAGKTLARLLRAYANDSDTLVLGLPRGGVPVAYEIARDLDVPLDIFIVRKLGVPRYEELAMGAIASGGARVLNEDVVDRLGISEQEIDAVAAREQLELERREREYRGENPPLDVSGKTVILVDDGLATGSTMRAAIEALRQKNAGQIVVAVPVGAPDSCERIARDADQLICPIQPEDFQAVGAWYDDFSQTTDAEVCELLSENAHLHMEQNV